MALSAAPYQLVDIGANLTGPAFNNRDLEAVLGRAKDSGVCKIIVTGTSVDVTKEAMRLCRLYPDYLYFTAGTHPHDAKHFTPECIDRLEELAGQPECVAIGECGLDFNRMFSPRETQLKVFDAQVQLACKLKKPLFVHEREAHEALVAILKKYEGQLREVVIHCFTGTMEEAKAYLDMGFYIGLTGYLWKDTVEHGVKFMLKNRLLPLNRLLVETDAPYMYPNIRAKKLSQDIKDKISSHASSFVLNHCSFQRNEPCSLPATVEMIAAYANVSPDEVALRTTMNAVKIFGLTCS
ncbi:hypothetical protein M514_07581 [Trichuris suis]|uniref:Deoxyribonuclease TATDN1 n=1 Tax=Trichuris suis TaxID=68888 RepID=A0A085NCL8_9BILA|nr:hypothetical protein M513_07581 [Trichuris suis]KFD67214.1 hypothetical protein M514_07581 [Trichuris suis]KHJ46782.1 hydrolase, TatD family [Trichuris suis]